MDWNKLLKRTLTGAAVICGVVAGAGEAKQLPEGWEFLGPLAMALGFALGGLGITSSGVKVEPKPPVGP